MQLDEQLDPSISKCMKRAAINKHFKESNCKSFLEPVRIIAPPHDLIVNTSIGENSARSCLVSFTSSHRSCSTNDKKKKKKEETSAVENIGNLVSRFRPMILRSSKPQVKNNSKRNNNRPTSIPVPFPWSMAAAIGSFAAWFAGAKFKSDRHPGLFMGQLNLHRRQSTHCIRLAPLSNSFRFSRSFRKGQRYRNSVDEVIVFRWKID